MFDRTLDFLEKNHLPVFVSFVVVVLGGSVWLINPFSTNVNQPTEAKAGNISSTSITSINSNFDTRTSTKTTSSSSINTMIASSVSSSSLSSLSASSISSISSVNSTSSSSVSSSISKNPMTPMNPSKLPITTPITSQPNPQNNLVNKDVDETDQTVQNTNTPPPQITTQIIPTTNSARPEFQLKNTNLTSTTPTSNSCPAGQLSVYTSNVGNMIVRKEEDFAQSALAQIKDFLNGSALQKQIGTTANFWQNPIYSNFIYNCGGASSNIIKNINVLATGADQTRAFVTLNYNNGQSLGDPTIEIYGNRNKNYFVITKGELVTQTQKEAAETKCKLGQINSQMNDTCYEQEMLKLLTDTTIQTNVLNLINQFALE